MNLLLLVSVSNFLDIITTLYYFNINVNAKDLSPFIWLWLYNFLLLKSLLILVIFYLSLRFQDYKNHEELMIFIIFLYLLASFNNLINIFNYVKI